MVVSVVVVVAVVVVVTVETLPRLEALSLILRVVEVSPKCLLTSLVKKNQVGLRVALMWPKYETKQRTERRKDV